MILENETFEKYGYSVKDLTKGMHKKVIIECDYCKNKIERPYCACLKCRENCNKDACVNCSGKKLSEVRFEKFGVEYPKINCTWCNKEFERRVTLAGDKNYCSRSCQVSGKNFKNGKTKHFFYKKGPNKTKKNVPSGYMRIYVGHDHPDSDNGYMYEHRRVMELSIGRRLEKHEVVHHKNGVRNDNRIENLELRTVTNHPPGYDNERLIEINKLLQENIELKNKLKLYENKFGTI